MSKSKHADPACLSCVDIGIPEAERIKIAEGLSRLLSDTYVLYLKTHAFHWNVTGPLFQTLHGMFETQYTELWAAIDVIAERIRALGVFAPGSFEQIAKLSSLKEEPSIPAASEMIAQLIKDNEAVARTARALAPLVDKTADQATDDLITGRLSAHEKTAWMLRSLL